MLSRHTAAAARLSRTLRPIASASASARNLTQSSVQHLPRQVPTKSYGQPSSARDNVSNVTEELSGTDPAVPWFLQSEIIDQPTQTQDSQSTPDSSSTDHFSYLPADVSTNLPEPIGQLQSHILSGPSANLIARPENADPEQTPITLIHPASLSKDPASDAYGENDWIVVVQVRSSAAGSVRRVALDIGNYLRHARTPAMGPEPMDAEDFLGPPPSRSPLPAKESAPIPPQRPKGVSRIEHQLGKSLPSWAVNRIALQRKFPDGWKPPKVLSREAQEGIRLLHTTNPEQFGVEELSMRFRISPESIRRILKAGKWVAPGEVRSRQDRRARENAHKSESAEIAELRRMEQENNEVVADGESPIIEDDVILDDPDAIEAEIKAQESNPGIVPVRYEGLVMTASDAASTNTTSKHKTNSKRGDGNWCLVDAEWCVVHVMTAQARFNYDIEGMWREFQQGSQQRAENPQDITSFVAAPPLKARSRARRDVLGQDIAKKNRFALAAQHRSGNAFGDSERRFGEPTKSSSSSSSSSSAATRSVGANKFRRGLATSAVSRSTDPALDLPATLNQLLSRVQQHSSSLPETTVTIKAWIRSNRRQKSATFLEVTDGSLAGARTLQAVLRTTPQDHFGTSLQKEQLAGLSVGTAVELTGQLRPGKGSKAGQEIELHVSALTVLSACDPTCPVAVKQQQQHSSTTAAGASTPESAAPYSASLAERRNPHLLGRLPRFAALMRTRDRIEQGMAAYLAQNEFVKVACPIITSTDCEGAGEVFQLGADSDVQSQTPLSSFWAASPAYLTVSSQLHLEALGLGLSRVWTLNPAFRAESSATNRHLAEFWMLEAEMYFAELEDAMDLAEGVIRAAIRAALTGTEDMQLLTHAHTQHLDALQAVLQPRKWARITYHAAHELLSTAHSQQHAFVTPPDVHAGLASEHEKFLAEQVFRAPVFVTHYPRDQKAFYMQTTPRDPSLVECFDLLIPGVGELVGGSARSITFQPNMTDNLHWYTHDLKIYGGALPHAGFGLGMERLAAYITFTNNVRDVVPFPRTKGRVRY